MDEPRRKKESFSSTAFFEDNQHSSKLEEEDEQQSGKPGRFQRKGHIKVTRQHLRNETENDIFCSLKGNKIKPQGVGNIISVCFHLLLGLSFLHSDQAWANGLL